VLPYASEVLSNGLTHSAPLTFTHFYPTLGLKKIAACFANNLQDVCECVYMYTQAYHIYIAYVEHMIEVCTDTIHSSSKCGDLGRE
jgi:hypothetical protein